MASDSQQPKGTKQKVRRKVTSKPPRQRIRKRLYVPPIIASFLIVLVVCDHFHCFVYRGHENAIQSRFYEYTAVSEASRPVHSGTHEWPYAKDCEHQAPCREQLYTQHRDKFRHADPRFSAIYMYSTGCGWYDSLLQIQNSVGIVRPWLDVSFIMAVLTLYSIPVGLWLYCQPSENQRLRKRRSRRKCRKDNTGNQHLATDQVTDPSTTLLRATIRVDDDVDKDQTDKLKSASPSPSEDSSVPQSAAKAGQHQSQSPNLNLKCEKAVQTDPQFGVENVQNACFKPSDMPAPNTPSKRQQRRARRRRLKKSKYEWRRVSSGTQPSCYESPASNLFLKHTQSSDVCRLELKFQCSRSVGILHKGTHQQYATGFRVGTNFVMACLHSVAVMLEIRNYETLEENYLKSRIANSISQCSITFHYYVDLISPKHFPYERLEFKFLPKVDYLASNRNMDVIVLEVEVPLGGPEPPQPLTIFGDVASGQKFDIYGHPRGDIMKIDQECALVNPNTQKFQQELAQLLVKCGVDIKALRPPYENIEKIKESCYLFATTNEHGGSGGPGVVFMGPGPKDYRVVHMLCGRYPIFIYELPDEIRSQINPEAIFDYGVGMWPIYADMLIRNRKLCSDIFRSYPPEWDDPPKAQTSSFL